MPPLTCPDEFAIMWDMGNEKIAYYNDYDCTDPSKCWHVSGIRNLYVFQIMYISTSTGKSMEFRMPYGRFDLALARYEYESRVTDVAPFGFVPHDMKLVVETYSDANVIHRDVVLLTNKYLGVQQ